MATLLISLTSSLGLLAVAATVVDFLATAVLPLKYVYRQYKQVSSIDFKSHDFTQDELEEFKRQDLVNPKPRFVRKLHIQGDPGETDSMMVTSTDAAALARQQQLAAAGYGSGPAGSASASAYGYQGLGDNPSVPLLGNGVGARTGAVVVASSVAAASVGVIGGEQRRGSGISLTSQQARPLPPCPPPPGIAVSREASFALPAGTGPHHVPVPFGMQQPAFYSPQQPLHSILSEGDESDRD